MIKIYSNIKKNLLLHIIFRDEDFKEGRQDLIEPDNFLQCSALKYTKGKTFKPHKHILKENKKHFSVTQESWVVMSGKVRCSFYDINNVFLTEHELHAGDASFTLWGGHTYEVLTNDALIYEFKSGPYYGRESDKIFID